jgi:hypothetical protein
MYAMVSTENGDVNETKIPLHKWIVNKNKRKETFQRKDCREKA